MATTVETRSTTGKEMDFGQMGFESLSPRWGRLMALGIAMMILGVLALGVSVFSTVVTVLFLGVIVAAGGIAQIINAFSSKSWGGFFLHLMLGLLYLVAGVIMMMRPAESAISLTLFLGVFFVASGVMRAVSALFSRFPSWGWSAFSGVISFILGLVVLRGMPTSGLWVIGTFVGIDLIFAGASMTGLAFAARRVGGIDRPWRQVPAH